MQRRICSIVRCTLSICPSVSGWKAVLGKCLVPHAAYKHFQNRDKNRGSRSVTIDLGSPCYRTITLTNALATASAVVSAVRGMKWAIFENLSITVRMFSKLSRDDFGRSVIRSMLTSSHRRMGIGNGLRSPAGFWVYAFWHWQTSHFSINATIWRNMPGHQNRYCNIHSTFLLEKCPCL